MRNNLVPAQPGDLREVYAQLLAVALLLEQQGDMAIHHHPKQLDWGLGRLLETLADELDAIARNWERWSVPKR